MNASARAKLEAAAAGISPAEISGTGRKTALVQFRLSEADKASIQRTADTLGVSVSQYLLAVHNLVAPRVNGEDLERFR
jgi:hypothetical protein